MNLTINERITTVNAIIEAIFTKGRRFFHHKGATAQITRKNGRLYMLNEYSGKEMCLSTKFGYPPKGWTHGGTLWGLTEDFKEFTSNGKHSNGNNGYGGLYCPHWGYDKAEMEAIRRTAIDLGYLEEK